MPHNTKTNKFILLKTQIKEKGAEGLMEASLIVVDKIKQSVRRINYIYPKSINLGAKGVYGLFECYRRSNINEGAIYFITKEQYNVFMSM